MKNLALKHRAKKRGRVQRLKKRDEKREMIQMSKSCSVKAHSDHLCDVCGKSYKTQTGLNQHRDTHNQLFKCIHCSISVKSKQCLKQHQTVAKKSPTSCSKCDVTFVCKGLLRAHVKLHSNGIVQYYCDVCDKNFASRRGFKVHQRTHNRKQWPCGQCKEFFLDKKELVKHQKEEHKISLLCEFCGKSFHTGKGLLWHRKSHTGDITQEKPHKCQECDKAFRTHSCLKLHGINHHGVKSSFVCQSCGKNFLNNSRLLEHIRITHTGEKIFSCPRCNKGFTCSRNLKRHLLEPNCSPQGEKYKCTQCNKTCKSKYSLMYHVTTHHGNKPFRCKFCDRGYATKENWEKHEAAHNGVYGVIPKKKVIKEVSLDFVCEECGKAYGNKHLLARHRLLHTGEKPHICERCSKSFRCKSTLTEHERIHSGEKPFHCEHCGTRFRLSGHLRYHLKALHKVKDIGRLKKIKPGKGGQNLDNAQKDSNESEEGVNRAAGEMIENRGGDGDKDEAVSSGKGTISKMAPDGDIGRSTEEQPVLEPSIGTEKVESLHPLIPSSDVNLTDSGRTEELLNMLIQGSWLQGHEQQDVERAREDIFRDQFGQSQLYQGQYPPTQSMGFDGRSANEKSYMYSTEQLNERSYIFGSLPSQSFASQSLQQMLFDPQQGKVNPYTYSSHQKKASFETDGIHQLPYELHQGQTETYDATQRTHQTSFPSGDLPSELPSSSGIDKESNLTEYEPQYKELETRSAQQSEVLNFEPGGGISHKPQPQNETNDMLRSGSSQVVLDGSDKVSDSHTSDKGTSCEMAPDDICDGGPSSSEQSLVISNSTIEKNLQDAPISKVLADSCETFSDAIDAIISKESTECEPLKTSSIDQFLPTAEQNESKLVTDVLQDVSKPKFSEERNVGELTKHLQDGQVSDDGDDIGFEDDNTSDDDSVAPKKITDSASVISDAGAGTFCCDNCRAAFKSQDDLDNHANAHIQTKQSKMLREINTEQKETSDNDQKTIQDVPNETNPEVVIKEEPPNHLCEVCGKSYQTKSSLRHHKKTHSTKLYRCIQCQRTFNSWNSMRMHNINHHDGKPPQQCSQCGKGFLHVAKLDEHIRIQHTGETPFSCHKCNKTFTCRRNLKRHLNEPMCSPKERFQCDQCQKTCKSQYSLSYHKSLHHTQKPYHCELCGKGYATKENCTRHENNHGELPKSAKKPKTTSKDFVCELCDKAYSNKHFLARHKQTHTGIKPFQCNVCSKAFLYKSALKEHVRTHTGEKPYICQHCGISFRLTGHLRYHLKAVHDGDKPYVCSICTKGFIFQSTMLHHMKTHTQENDKPEKSRTEKGSRSGGGKRRKNKRKRETLSGSAGEEKHLGQEVCAKESKTGAVSDEESSQTNLARDLRVALADDDVSAVPTGILRAFSPTSAISVTAAAAETAATEDLTTQSIPSPLVPQDHRKNFTALQADQLTINNNICTTEDKRIPEQQTENLQNHDSTISNQVSMLTPPVGFLPPSHTQSSSLLAALAAHAAGSILPHPNYPTNHTDYQTGFTTFVPFLPSHVGSCTPQVTEFESQSSTSGMSNEHLPHLPGVLPMHSQRPNLSVSLAGGTPAYSGYAPVIPWTTN